MSFPRYSKYKYSGVQWIGDIPDGWVVKRLGYITRSGMGQTITREMLETQPSREAIPVYSASEVDEVFGHFINPTIVLQSGDLVVGARGSIGMARRITTAATCTQTTIWLKPTGGFRDSSYLYWCMVGGREGLFPFDKTAVPMLTLEQVRSGRVPYPPLNEQRVIAEFLDRETAKIDALVAEQRRLMELLKEKIASLVLSSADLSNTQRLRFCEAASIVSRPVLQKKDESYTRIGLLNRGRGLFHKDASEMEDMGESDFFWVEEGDLIISGQFAWEGAVAMADKDDTGCVVSHRYPVIRGVPGIAMTEYLFGLLCTNHGDFLLNEHSRGAAGRNRPLNIRSLMKEKIPIPKIEIQEAVARAIHSRTALLGEISKTINLLHERRSVLISNAVTGQIDLREYLKNNHG